MPPEGRAQVRVRVTNTGPQAGDEVVQLYVRDVVASVPVPIRQLQGFQRVHLAPGESQTVTFGLTPRQLSLIDERGQRMVEPGEFEIAVGGSQPDDHKAPTPPLRGMLTVRGETTRLA